MSPVEGNGRYATTAGSGWRSAQPRRACFDADTGASSSPARPPGRRRGGEPGPARPRPARAGQAGASGRRSGSALSVSSRRPKSRSAACRARSTLPAAIAARDRQLFAALQAQVVERLNRVQELERIGRRALLHQKLGEVEPQVRLGPSGLDDLGQLGDRLILFVAPPQDRAERQPRVNRFGGARGRDGLAAEVVDQVAQEIVSLEKLERRAQAPG